MRDERGAIFCIDSYLCACRGCRFVGHWHFAICKLKQVEFCISLIIAHLSLLCTARIIACTCVDVILLLLHNNDIAVSSPSGFWIRPSVILKYLPYLLQKRSCQTMCSLQGKIFATPKITCHYIGV